MQFHFNKIAKSLKHPEGCRRPIGPNPLQIYSNFDILEVLIQIQYCKEERGGKYVWDPVDRTISLDYLYDTENSLLELMSENGLDVNIKITDRAVEFALPTGLWCYSITYDTSEMFESGNRPERPIPLRYKRRLHLRFV